MPTWTRCTQRKASTDTASRNWWPNGSSSSCYTKTKRRPLAEECSSSTIQPNLARGYGEIKRMYVRPEFRGRRYAKQMLKHIEELATARGFSKVRLETGIPQPEAIGLYERNGYYKIPPFGDYWDDPLSFFYEKRLDL